MEKEIRYFVKCKDLNNKQIGLALCFKDLDNALDYVYDNVLIAESLTACITKIYVNPLNIDNDLKAFEKKVRVLKND